MYRQAGARTLFVVLFFFSASANAAIDNDPVSIQSAYDRGDYVSVIDTLEQSSTYETPSIHSTQQIRWLVLHANSYRKLGRNEQAVELILAVLPAIEAHEQQAEAHALYYGQVGWAQQTRGETALAEDYFYHGINIARHTDAAAVEASLQNDLGNLFATLDYIPRAIAAYRASLIAANRVADDALISTAAANLARALLETSNARDVRATLNIARQAAESMPNGADKLSHLLAIGRLYETAQESMGYSDDLRLAANDLYLHALRMAEKMSDQRSMSYALGYLGGLYETEQKVDEATRLTERAIEFAHLADADDALFQWEWQMARLHVQVGDLELALGAYRRALRSVREIRGGMLANASQMYQEYVGPLYFEMADLLLQRTATLSDANAVQANLQEVRQTLESLKTAEIIEYFDNDCVIQDQDRAALEQLSATAAIIYPIMMEDRLELLVSFPGDIRQVTVAVGRDELTQVIRRFRLGIESTSGGNRYLESAQQLYAWLIRPLEAHLGNRQIDTLVFVPDGALRTIPMSALHDGQQFLVEKYALATTPGISLTSAAPVERVQAQVLANGITESVQGFSALPNVAEELQSIEQLYPTRLNQDSNFRLTSVERSMSEGDYSIVHIATHGQFDSDHRNSFLLAYDEKMTMNRLEEALSLRRYQDNAIELLVLSACQTAAGDDRAALGMAGIAIKAGARSALATLWFINDASTSILMQDFYKNLQINNMSKAEALQRAQVKMLANPAQSHPAHWAPFLLIGNWL